MALLGNKSVLNKSVAVFTAGSSTAGAYVANTRSNWQKAGAARNRYLVLDKGSSTPEGTRPPYSFVIAQSSAVTNLASFTFIRGESDVSGSLLEVKLATSALTGSGDIVSADLSVISPASATLSGTGTLSADAQTVANMSAALEGTGSISQADLSAIVPIAALLTGLGEVSGNLTGRGRLEAEITPFTDLSPQSLATQILDNSEIEASYSLREAMRLVLASLAGKVSGAGTSTITIRDVNDTIDRIVATVDSNGNRTDVTKDVS